VEDRNERIEIGERIAAISEPLGYDAQILFGSSDVPNLTILRLETWKIRLTGAGDVSARRTWEK
jgi:hypothetical protein